MQLKSLLSRRTRTLALLLCSCLTGSLSLMAAPIEVNNHSFEMPALGAGGWTNDLPPITGPEDPQWQDAPDGDPANRFVEFIGGFFSEGSQHIGMAAGHYIFQNLGIPYEANTTYTLTVGVGYRNPTQSGTESFTVIGLTALEGPPADDNLLGGATTQGQLDSDALLSSASARVESVSLNNAQMHTYTDVTVELTTDDNPPSGNIVIFLGDDDGGVRSHFDNVRLEAITALDPDGDGIPEEWETGTDRGVARDLDPNADDGGEDPDGDTLTNFEEYEAGTHPRLADTDGDGLNDNFETTTDPLNPDVDGDTLLDGEEIATHQTDPNDTDSDDDTFEDQAEVAAGTDPNDPDSKPALGGAIRVGGNFVGGNAMSPGAEVTGMAGVVPQENWNNFPGGAGDPVIANNSAGEPSLLRVSWQTNGPGVAGDDPSTPDEQLMYGLLLPRGDGAGGDDVITEITVQNIAYPLYDLYLYFNATDPGMAVYEANDEVFSVEVTPFDGTFVEVTEDGGSGNYIHFENLTGSTLVMRGRTLGITGFQIEREKPADPSLLAIPDRLDFGEYDGNPGPQELTFRIINPGEAQTLTITDSTITGDGAGKYAVSGLPDSLGPNEGADVTVTYNPTDDVGIDRGFLEITSNSAVGATSVIPLIGQIKHANGLVAHFTMDETEGTEMIDSSGNGYNGTYVAGSGSVTLGSAALASGSAVAFSEGGDAAYAEVPANVGLPTLAEGSYSFWVQQDAADLGTPSVLFSRSSSPANPYAVFIEEATDNPDAVIWTSEAATQTLVSEPFMVFDEPIHIVYTYSDPNEDGIADVAVYVNGVLNASATGTSGYPLGTIAPFQIGGSAGQFGFTGVIDDFQIYEGVLTPEQIADMYADPGSVAPVDNPLPPAGELLADSTADFGGTQGLNDWRYGYRLVEEDTDDYDPTTDFIEFPEDWWNGTNWDEPNADGDNVPWTTIAADNSHPNGDNNGEVHWTIRRWTSDYTGDAIITWSAAKQNVDCGNGVTVGVYLNGVRQDAEVLDFDDGEGFENQLLLPLVAGESVVDLVHSPKGGDNSNEDGCDGTFTAMRINAVAGPLASLVGYWDLNEGDGTVVAEDSDPALNGTVNNGTWVAGHSGVEGDFAVELTGEEGGTSNVELPALNETFTEITITGWVNGVPTGDWTGLIQSRDAAQPIGLGFRAASGELTYTWNDNNANTYDFVSGLAIPANEWTFIALRVTPDEGKLYVGSDGVLNSAVNAIEHLEQGNPTVWHLGKDNCCEDTRNFQGAIDNVAIFNMALSDEDIQAIFEGDLLGPDGPPDSNLLVNGSFEEPVLDNINTNNLGVAPVGWSQTGDPATWNLIRNDGTPYGSGVDMAADGFQIIDLNGEFEIFQNFTVTEPSNITFGASFANREAHDGSAPSTVGIYDAAGTTLLSPLVTVDTSADPTPSEVWRSGEESVVLDAGEYQIRIVLNNFNNVDAVYALASPPVPPGNDSDGDGVTDDLETIAGTDPNDPTSYLRVTGVENLAQGGGNELVWSSVDGKSYHVEYSTDLTAWTMITDAPIAATGEATSFTDTDAGRLSEPEGYYRVVVVE